MTLEPDQPTRRGRRSTAPVRHGRRKRSLGVVLPAVAGVLAMAVVLTGVYAGYAYSTLSGSLTKVNAIPGLGGGKSDDDDVDGKAQNILLVGDDHRPEGATQEQMSELSTTGDGGSSNTDTMIVLHIAADGKSATMISFPRDSYVDIPGVGKNKLNSAFYFGTLNGGGNAGGAQLLIKTIQGLSGLTIDHYVRVSLLGFYQIVQQLGPVQVCLNNPVQDRYSGIDLPAGTSELTPKQALSFVRQRHGLPNGDLDRQVRQQYFLSQEARKILSAGTLLNPVKTSNVLKTIGSSIETDQGFDMLSLATQMRNLRPGNIRSATIPTLGTPTITVNGAPLSVVEVDEAGMPAFVQSLVGPPEAYTKATAADPASVSVTVHNGSGVAGAAAAASTVLGGRGFQVGAPGSETMTKATVVEYPAGMESQAKAVVAAVPGSTGVLTSSVTGVTLLLGTDGKTAVAAQPSAPATSGSSDGSSSSGGSSSGGSSSAASKQPSAPKSTPAGNAYGTKGSCIN